MTAAAKTPSQRGRSNRNRGLNAERDLCKWLRTNGFPHAERAVRTGFRTLDRTSADPGDVMGSPGIVWSVKDSAVERLAKWFTELEAMATADEVGLLVHKRRGHADPGRWWCWLTLTDLVRTVRTDTGPSAFTWGGWGTTGHYPVRMELQHVVPLIRAAGYGSPLEVAS